MKKRLFQIFDEMNVNDENNKTATLPCAFDMVEAKSDKRGGLITMGVEAHIVKDILFGLRQPILIVMDKKEYHRLEAIPVEDTAQQQVEQLEQWKAEAKLLLDPLLEWGQAQKDVPLGGSITSEILRRAKLYTESQQRIEQLEKALNQITNVGWSLGVQGCINVANNALNPKTDSDEQAE